MNKERIVDIRSLRVIEASKRISQDSCAETVKVGCSSARGSAAASTIIVPPSFNPALSTNPAVTHAELPEAPMDRRMPKHLADTPLFGEALTVESPAARVPLLQERRRDERLALDDAITRLQPCSQGVMKGAATVDIDVPSAGLQAALAPRSNVHDAAALAAGVHDRSVARQLEAKKALRDVGPATLSAPLGTILANPQTNARTARNAARALGAFGTAASMHMEPDMHATIQAKLGRGHREVQLAVAEFVQDSTCLPGFVPSTSSHAACRARGRSAVHGLAVGKANRAKDPVPAVAPGGGQRHCLSARGRRPVETVHRRSANAQLLGA